MGPLARPSLTRSLYVQVGARSLGGVEDSDVYGLRGQTVLVRVPWIATGTTRKIITEGVMT